MRRFCILLASEVSDMKKPNVIYILADDMGYGDFAAFNGGITHTPALDMLVSEGVTLRECYSSSPVCAPARASILTGRYPQRTGVIDTLETRGLDRMKLDETTMADVFRYNGYATALIGKWHLGAIGDEYHPNQRGFDYFFGFRGGWSDYYNYHIQRNGDFLPCEEHYLTDVFTEDCVRYIKENKDHPFFIHLAYNAPHFPHEAPQEIIERYRNTGKYTDTVSTIYAMIECMDQGIGKILQTLKSEGIDDNTIILFTSDNGPEMELPGDYDNMSTLSSARFNCNLRGYKTLVYEGGLKVPAVLRWPAKFQRGLHSTEVISHIDWLPTFMNLCNLAYPQKLKTDGIDITPALDGKTLDSRILCWQWNRLCPELKGNAAIRQGDWKLIHPPISEHLVLDRYDVALDEDIKRHPQQYCNVVPLPLDIPDAMAFPSQLFNLSVDPCEKIDFLEQQLQLGQELESELDIWFKAVECDRLREVN